MLEVVIPGVRFGEGVISSSTAYCGCMCFIAGVNSSGQQTLRVPNTTAEAAMSIYPINKYYFAEDYNDTSDAVDKFTAGDTCIYYSGGEYITDKFNQSSIGLTAAYWAAVEGSLSTVEGRKIYYPGSSTAGGTIGLQKLFVGTGAGMGRGYLIGSTATCTTLASASGYVAIGLGVYYEDSSNAKLRFRVAPGRLSAYIGKANSR